MPRRLASLLLLAVFLAACGGDDGATKASERGAPVLGGKADQADAAGALGFPAFATKNTTRVGASDSVAAAAGVAQAVFPSRSKETRPAAVVLVDRADWRASISASQLMSRPLRAPILFTEGGKIPAATSAALKALAPAGARAAGGAQVLRIGDAPKPEGYEVRDLPGADFSAQAQAIDALVAKAQGSAAKKDAPVLIAPSNQPAIAMAAAGWAAKAGSPVLWVTGGSIPPATRATIRAHGKPRIFLLGPASAIPASVATQLGRLGRVERIGGDDGPSVAVTFARYSKAGFGWNAVDPGHGFVFASPKRPADAAAAAALSGSGTYGPLLLVSEPGALDAPVENYLLDVQPGYESDPVRGVYNHGWLVGDESSISVDVQSRIDALLEIQPVAAQPATN